MAKVYEALEKVDEIGEPAPDMETALSILTELKGNFGDMKSYDRSVVWHPHAGHFRLKTALKFARKMTDIGGGAAHVKTNQLIKTGFLAGLHHTDNPPGRTGKDCIFALEFARICEPAV